MRNLDSAITTEVANNESTYPIDLVEVIVDPNDSNKVLRVSSGFKPFTFDSKTFTPVGALLGMSAVTETRDAKTNPITISLSGIDDSVIATLESDRPFGSEVNVYRGFYDIDSSTEDFIADPYVRWSGIVVALSTSIDNSREGTVTVTVQCKSKLNMMLASKGGRFTSPESFKQFNSTDESMEFVSAMRTFNPTFGGNQ